MDIQAEVNNDGVAFGLCGLDVHEKTINLSLDENAHLSRGSGLDVHRLVALDWSTHGLVALCWGFC